MLGVNLPPQKMVIDYIPIIVSKEENLDFYKILKTVILAVSCEEIRINWLGRRFTFIKDLDGQSIELNDKA